MQLGSQDLTIQKMLKERTSERNLKAACISLLFKMDFSFADDDYVLVSFKTDEDERLAKLITYGDGKCMGSDILLRALS